MLASDPQTSKQNERALNEIVEEEKTFLKSLAQSDKETNRKLVVVAAKRGPEPMEAHSRPERLGPSTENYQHYIDEEQIQQ